MSIPHHRRLIVDLMKYQREIPSVPHDLLVDVGFVNDRRRLLAARISWPAIMIRAFALVAGKFPQLRQTFLRGPVPRIYEHPCSVAMLSLAREYRGDKWLFFARIRQPEVESLAEIQRRIDRFATGPVERVFRDQLRVVAMPWPLRAVLWHWRLYFSGSTRVRRLGTFGLTTLARKGVSITHPVAPIPYVLSYGPFDEEQRMRISVTYDHRLVDGSTIADVLNALDGVLSHQILDEMKALPTSSGFRAAAEVACPSLEGSA